VESVPSTTKRERGVCVDLFIPVPGGPCIKVMGRLTSPEGGEGPAVEDEGVEEVWRQRWEAQDSIACI
jgi:hypothetical protein